MFTKRAGLYLVLGIFTPLLGLSFLGLENFLFFAREFIRSPFLNSILRSITGITYLSVLTPYFIFVGFLLLIGFIFSLLKFKISTRLKNIEIERDLSREKLFAGDFLRVTLTVRNSGGLMVDHIYLADLLPDVFDLSLGENFLATSLPPGSEVEYSYVVRPPVRGEYELGPIYVAFQDRARFFVKEREIKSTQKIVVYPQYEAVKRMKYLEKAKGGLTTGKHKVKERGSGYNFSRLREYLPSDDIRFIDWAASARMRDLIVKQYQKEKNIRLYLLLDTSHSMGYGKEEMTKLDAVVRAATFLAYMAERAGDNFGLITFSNTVHNFIPANRGKPHFFRVLQEISKIDHGGTSNLPAAIRELMVREPRSATPLIFSDLEGKASLLEKGVQTAVAHQLNPVIIAPVGPYFERGERERGLKKAFSEAALAEYFHRRERIKRDLFKYRVNVIDFGPDETIAGALEAYFSSKARRGGIT